MAIAPMRAAGPKRFRAPRLLPARSCRVRRSTLLCRVERDAHRGEHHFLLRWVRQPLADGRAVGEPRVEPLRVDPGRAEVRVPDELAKERQGGLDARDLVLVEGAREPLDRLRAVTPVNDEL